LPKVIGIVPVNYFNIYSFPNSPESTYLHKQKKASYFSPLFSLTAQKYEEYMKERLLLLFIIIFFICE
jgi:hypothetical protein